MKRVSRLLLAALVLLAVLVVAYYIVEVVQARRATPAIVATALWSENILLQADRPLCPGSAAIPIHSSPPLRYLVLIDFLGIDAMGTKIGFQQ